MKNKIHEAVVQNWALENWRSQGYLQFVDLHLDEIDPAWSVPNRWFDVGLMCLKTLNHVVRENQMPLIPALGFSLESGSHPLGPNFSTVDEMSSQLSITPPSLYLFAQDQTAWSETPGFALLAPEITKHANHFEWSYSEYISPPDPDYRRVVWVVGKPQRQQAQGASDM